MTQLRREEDMFSEIVPLLKSLTLNAKGQHHGSQEGNQNSAAQDLVKKILQSLTLNSSKLYDHSLEESSLNKESMEGSCWGRRYSKNLFAERRRKKLNDRLYQLRDMVGIKDGDSILQRTIESIKHLQQQAKGLQDELKEAPGEDKPNNTGCENNWNEKLTTVDHGTKCCMTDKESDFVKQSLMTGDQIGRGDEILVEPNYSKNLLAERERRKKLSPKVYALRALLPETTEVIKMPGLSTIDRGIEFIKELQQHIKDICKEHGNDNKGQWEHQHKNIINHDNVNSSATDASNTTDEKKTQMKVVQIEVSPLGENELFIKVAWEYRPGGFVRLMEAINRLGLEVKSTNGTTFRGIDCTVLTIESENGSIQADQLKEALLHLQLNQSPEGKE